MANPKRDGPSHSKGEMRDVAWQILRVHMLMTKRLAARLEDIGLHIGQPRLMHYIKKHPNTSQSEIAHHMMVTNPAMTHAIKRLVHDDLIETTYDADDQRRKVMRLTEKGQAVLDTCDHMIAEEHAKVYEGLTEADLEQLSRILSLLEEHFVDEA